MVRAEPGLHFEPLYGPLSPSALQPPRPAAFGVAQPLLPVPSRAPISYQAAVDSVGMAHYGRRVSGFADGTNGRRGSRRLSPHGIPSQAPAALAPAESAATFAARPPEQRRRKGSRFEWTVPFSAPKPLRRFIGDEGPSLRLNGSRTIIISGKSEWTDGEVQTSFGRSSKFPALGIEQESDFTVEGKVGELISIRINQDTQNFGSALSSNLSDQLANQIKLDYKGEDDSIFQEVQAGKYHLRAAQHPLRRLPAEKQGPLRHPRQGARRPTGLYDP